MLRLAASRAVGELALRWGAQVDARPLRADGDGPDDDAVAAYVAKYVTKGASETGAGVDHALSAWGDIESAPVSGHVRTLMRTCWHLGSLAEYAPLRLRDWAHTLGYRGHILTKSRAYSTPPTRPCAPTALHTKGTAWSRKMEQSRKPPGVTSAPATPLALPNSPPESRKISP